MDQFYYESGYIDEKYYVYIAEGEMLLGVYIDAGYIDPNYYYGEEAEFILSCDLTEVVGEVVEAIGSWSSEFSLSVAVTRIQQVSSTQSSEFTQTALVGKIQSATVNAGALFSPSFTVNAIRNSFAVLDTLFTIDTTAVANRSITQTLENIANLDAQAARFVGVSSQQSTQADLTLVSQLFKTSSVDLDSNFAVDSQALRFRNSQADLNSELTLAVTADKFKDSQADLSSEFTQTSTIGIVKQFNIDAGSLFTPQVDINVTLNALATIEATVTVSAQAQVTRNLSSNIEANTTQSATAEVTRLLDSTVSSEFALSADAERFRTSLVTLSSAFDQSATATRIQPAASDLNSNFAIEASAARTRDDSATISSEFAQSVDYIRYRDTGSTQASEFSQSVTVFRIQLGSIDLTSTSMLVADAVKTADVVSTATAEFTQTTQAVKTVDVLPVLESIATSLAVAAKNATGTITLESAFASTALIGKIQQAGTELGGQGVALVPESDPLKPFLLLEPLAAQDTTSKFVMSFHLSSNTTGQVFDGNYVNLQGEELFGGTSNVRVTREDGVYSLEYRGQTAREQIYPYVRWRLNYTEQQQYHHYLLMVDLTKPGTIQDWYQLYVDGEKQILTEVTGSYPVGDLKHPLAIGSPNTSEPEGIVLGTGLTRTNGLFNSNRKLAQQDGDQPSLLQFWLDYDRDYDFEDLDFRRKFYPGKYVDFGEDGTLTGLPAPKYYVGLRNYTDILEQGTRTTNALTNWKWKQLTGFSQSGGVTGYGLSDFTATTDQNSVYTNKNIVAVFDIEVTLIGVLLYGANLNSTTALTAEGTLVKGLVADLLAETAQSSVAVKTTDVISTQVTESTQVAVVDRFRQGVVDADSEFTILAGIGTEQQASSDLVSEFAFAATTTIIDPTRGEADLNADSTVAATVTRIKPLASSMSATAELAADVTVIPPIRAEADLLTQSALAVDALKIVQTNGQLTSVFAVSVATSVTVGVITAVQAEFGLEAEAFKVTGIAPTTLQVTGFVLTAGDVINFDPFLTLKIKQETRGLIIDPENRVISIEQETRLNIIQGY